MSESCRTPPSLPATTIPEFIAYARSRPGQINMASTGVGTAPHLAGELFNMMAGVKLFHIPYRSNFMPDLVGGQVQVSFPRVLSVAGYVTNGQLRALGVTGASAPPYIRTFRRSVNLYLVTR
jgi:tripartite-type tricarboxylate transporter receptor subunit TctC